MVPVEVAEQEIPCNISSREYTLEMLGDPEVAAEQIEREIEAVARSGCDEPECLIIMAPFLTLAVGSLVISGSIVILNNTAHWLEIEGTCDDGAIKVAVDDMKEFADELGGQVVKSKDQFVRWFRNGINRLV